MKATTTKRLVWGAVGAAGLLLGVVLVVHHAAMDRQLLALEADYLTQPQLDRLMADQQRLADAGLFLARTRTRDAGEILNPLVPLDGGPERMRVPAQASWWEGDEVRRQVRGPRQKGKRKKGEPRKPGRWELEPEAMPEGDLSITRELLAYDHWETSSPGGRYAEYLATDDHPSLAQSPIPNMIDLQTLARLRMARGLATGDMRSALEETRHLARLVHSAEGLVYAMVARAILGIERLGYEQAVKRGLMAAGDWTPVTDEERVAMRRVGFGMVMVASGWTVPDDALDQVQGLGVPLFGLCAGVTESVFQHHMRFPAWDGLLLERDLSHMTENLQATLVKTPQCRVPVARQAMDTPGRMTMDLWLSSMRVAGLVGLVDKGASLSMTLLQLPYLRGPVMTRQIKEHSGVSMWLHYGATAAEDYQGVF